MIARLVLLAVLASGVFCFTACSDSSPTEPVDTSPKVEPDYDISGTWTGVVTAVAIGPPGHCVVEATRPYLPVSGTAVLSLQQNVADLSGTWTDTRTGIACHVEGGFTLSYAIELRTTSCDVPCLQNVTCGDGSPVRMCQAATTFTGTVSATAGIQGSLQESYDSTNTTTSASLGTVQIQQEFAFQR